MTTKRKKTVSVSPTVKQLRSIASLRKEYLKHIESFSDAEFVEYVAPESSFVDPPPPPLPLEKEIRAAWEEHEVATTVKFRIGLVKLIEDLNLDLDSLENLLDGINYPELFIKGK